MVITKKNVKTFKFFEIPKKRKVSNKSPIPIPLRRTTRLKSDILLDSFSRDLPDGEYDITKEDFDCSILELQSLKNKTKLSESPSNIMIEELDRTAIISNKSKQNIEGPVEAKASNNFRILTTKKRSTRLNTEIFEKSFRANSSDVESDIPKEDFDSTISESLPNIVNKILDGTDIILDKSKQNMKSSKKRKASHKSPIPYTSLRRSTRLKSEHFAESLRVDLSHEESFDCTILELQPIKKKTKLSESAANEKNGTLDRIDIILDNNLKSQSGKVEIDVQKVADNLIKTIDTNAIANMVKNINVINIKESGISTKNRQRTQTKISDQILDDETIYDSVDHENESEDLNTKKHTRGSDELFEKPRIQTEDPNQEPKNFKMSKRQEKSIQIENFDPILDTLQNGRGKSEIVSRQTELTKKQKVISKDSSRSFQLSEDDKKSNPSKKKRNSTRTKNTQSCNKTLSANNHNPQANVTNVDEGNMQKSTKISVQPKKPIRKPKDLTVRSNKNGNLKHVRDKLLDEQSKSPKNNVQDKPLNGQTKSPKNKRKNKNLPINKNSIQSPVISPSNKIKNSEPEKRTKPQTAKKHVSKKNLAKKQPHQIRYTKFSKLTKDQIRQANTRKIPKERLNSALEMFANEDHPIWEDRNISCNPSIHIHWQSRASLISDQNMKLKYARQFLLRRDWINLSKILCLSNSAPNTYFPLLSKYATLLLAHTNKDKFDKFVQFLLCINDSSAIIKKCTQISNGNEE